MRFVLSGLIVASGMTMTVANMHAALPSNSWLGLKSFALYDGALAACSLTGTGTNSAWVAMAGTASLDIVQVGVRHTASGNRWFAAWGRGEPYGANSLYRDADLGGAGVVAHRYAVQLMRGSWSLMIDGRTRATVSDAFRDWVIRSAQVQSEVETSERLGPSACSGARAHRGKWALPAWSFGGYGVSATVASVTQGVDWYEIH